VTGGRIELKNGVAARLTRIAHRACALPHHIFLACASTPPRAAARALRAAAGTLRQPLPRLAPRASCAAALSRLAPQRRALSFAAPRSHTPLIGISLQRRRILINKPSINIDANGSGGEKWRGHQKRRISNQA